MSSLSLSISRAKSEQKVFNKKKDSVTHVINIKFPNIFIKEMKEKLKWKINFYIDKRYQNLEEINLKFC